MPAAADLLLDPPVDRELPTANKILAKTNTEVCRFHSLPDRQRHEKFFKDAVNVLLEDAIFKGTHRENRVLEWRDPEKLLEILDLKLENRAVTHEKLLSLIKDTIKYSVKTGHPYFVNQLFSR